MKGQKGDAEYILKRKKAIFLLDQPNWFWALSIQASVYLFLYLQ